MHNHWCQSAPRTVHIHPRHHILICELLVSRFYITLQLVHELWNLTAFLEMLRSNKTAIQRPFSRLYFMQSTTGYRRLLISIINTIVPQRRICRR